MLPRQVPAFILPLTRAHAAFWGQSIRFWVEKLFSEKVSPHFPSTPGSEELIAHPLPKFLPMDPAEGGEPGEPQALPSAPLIPSHVGGPGGSRHCWEEQEPRGDAGRKARSHHNVPARPLYSSPWGSAAGKSPPRGCHSGKRPPKTWRSSPHWCPQEPPGRDEKHQSLAMGVKGACWVRAEDQGALSLRGTRCGAPPHSRYRCPGASSAAEAFPLRTRRAG